MKRILIGIHGQPAVCALAVAALGLLSASALAQPVQNPLITKQTAEANILLTLDDAAYMANAYAPDSLSTVSGSRQFKSAQINALYYDPTVRYLMPANADATVSGVYMGIWTGFTSSNVYVNGFASAEGTVNLTAGWKPTLAYTPAKPTSTHTLANANTTAGDDGVAYYTTFNSACGNAANDNCFSITKIQSITPSYVIPAPNARTDCPTAANVTTCTYAQESLNFAIWYSFYRTRNLQMVSTTARALAAPALFSSRIAWQTTNSGSAACTGFDNANCKGWDTTKASTDARLLTLDNTRLTTSLYPFLSNVGASGASSPLRSALQRAGRYFATDQSSNSPYSPYLKTPQTAYNASTNPEYSCRPNFHLLLTYGDYSDSDAGSYCGTSSAAACSNTDGGSASLPDGTSFNGATAPFSDAAGNTLADVAMYYWSRDLRGGVALNNNLTPYFADRSGGSASAQFWNARNDPATWQHMVNFIVGIGLTPSAFSANNLSWGTDAFTGAGYTSLLSGTAWPAASAAGTQTSRFYDLWHAAINSRGNLYVGASPDAVVSGLTSAITRVASQTSFGAALATNSTRLTSSSVLYQASFDNNDWTGELVAIDVNTDGSLGNQLWTASSQIPAAANRKIFTADATQINNSTGMVAGNGISFDWASLPASMQNLVGSSALLSYLRGDQGNEGNGAGQYRPRSRRLGDIVDSDIAYTAGENFGYTAILPENGTSTIFNDSYSPYVASKQSRTPMIYVGANDGMLHGFDANTGIEQFAYVPLGALLPYRDAAPVNTTSRLTQLADNALATTPYVANHRFSVDSSPWVGDACTTVSTVTVNGQSTTQCTSWKTLVVGATGAGGKGVFALDVTNPTSFSASNVLWDLTGTNGSTTTDNDLGYTLGQPVIGRLPDGNWYAIFGNGYNSASGCVVLYLVRLSNGAITKVSATSPSGNNTTCQTTSGLGRPSLYSSVNSRVTDTIYAGDLSGRLWKFDVSSANSSSWSASTFFTAKDASNNPQPITGLIEIGRPPTSVNTGVMLYFGTGKYFASGDDTNTSQQTFYGLWDSGSAISGRNKLQAQTITVTGSGLSQTRTISTLTVGTNDVKYTANGANQQFGFYLDLPNASNPGERIVNAPVLLPGRVLMATLIPSVDPCLAGGTSAIMAIDPFNGTAIRVQSGNSTTSIFNTNYDSVMSTVDVVKNLVAIDSGTNVYLYAGGSSGQIQTVKTAALKASDGAARGRASWREIFR